jgi:hypothetical protein
LHRSARPSHAGGPAPIRRDILTSARDYLVLFRIRANERRATE